MNVARLFYVKIVYIVNIVCLSIKWYTLMHVTPIVQATTVLALGWLRL